MELNFISMTVNGIRAVISFLGSVVKILSLSFQIIPVVFWVVLGTVLLIIVALRVIELIP